MKNADVNTKIIDLWNTYCKDDPNVYAPLFYDEFKSGGLLFVGCNPAFSIQGIKSILKDTEFSNIHPEQFFKWYNIFAHPELIDDCITFENYIYQNALYFNRPAEIAKKLGFNWQHIDLFLYKETNQRNFISRIMDKGILNDFAKAQITLFTDILTTIDPQCIIVINAFASEILRNHMKEYLIWDQDRGFHLFVQGGKKVPIFFSSMLSGQRALDRWSYERLVWHIRQAVK